MGINNWDGLVREDFRETLKLSHLDKEIRTAFVRMKLKYYSTG
jgi:hypothetical protein